MLGDLLWKPLLRRTVTGRWRRMELTPGVKAPFPDAVKRLGLYLHVPFCRTLCPFCPYNRVRYDSGRYARYERAVHQEVDLYAPHLADAQIPSLYIGGGTPTVDLPGLLRIVAHLRDQFASIGDICVELHPQHMEDACLAALRASGVNMLSIGVESTSDRLLRRIGRSHDGATAIDAVRRGKLAGFDTVNADLMFALPTQTLSEWETDLARVTEAGADQISTYPLFLLPCSEAGRRRQLCHPQQPPTERVKRMLDATDRIAEASGMHRCAVWSWIRGARQKFSSVTRHHYLGFGPSASSMIGSHFYVNTFDVDAYASALPAGRPIAVCMELERRLEMAYWLYWRAYELRVSEREFRDLFGAQESLERHFGLSFVPFLLTGLLRHGEDGYQVTRAGAYWIHRIQNEYSLSYISRLWGRCRETAWPAEVVL